MAKPDQNNTLMPLMVCFLILCTVGTAGFFGFREYRLMQQEAALTTQIVLVEYTLQKKQLIILKERANNSDLMIDLAKDQLEIKNLNEQLQLLQDARLFK